MSFYFQNVLFHIPLITQKTRIQNTIKLSSFAFECIHLKRNRSKNLYEVLKKNP